LPTGEGDGRDIQVAAMTESRYRVVSLERGLRILSVFTAQHRALGASDIARRVGLPTATVYRLLRTLESSGFVIQHADGSFTPTAAVLALGYAALQFNDPVEAAREPLQQLAARTGETTNFGTRVGNRVLYLLRFKTEHLIIANIYPGSTLPLGRTSMGKLLLALGEDADLAALIPDPAAGEPLGPNAITSEGDLETELAAIRSQGWSVQDEELAPNLRSVAVPVYAASGLAGAVNIAVDAQRYTRDSLLSELLPQLRQTASAISLKLGYLDAVR
jgi:IclR family pca regulon transcriptional regulator